MSYYNQLHPWHIIHCLPNAQTQTIARFRRRNDAEAHLRVLQQLTPIATYRIIFVSAENEQEQGDRPDTDSIQFQANSILVSRRTPQCLAVDGLVKLTVPIFFCLLFSPLVLKLQRY